nr:MAG TPA: hypothetical protein [Crassvirales sp.]
MFHKSFNKSFVKLYIRRAIWFTILVNNILIFQRFKQIVESFSSPICISMSK